MDEDVVSGACAPLGPAGSCWFECGQTHDLYNIGNARVVKLVCGLCNSSRKALDSQGRTASQLKIVLDDLKKNRQSAYKAKVRSGRIVPGSEDHPHSNAERREMLAEYAQEVAIEASVRDEAEVLWPNLAEYIAYRTYWHGLDEGQARAAFEVAKNNPDIQKRGTREDPRVPLAGIPKTVGSVQRKCTRRLNVFSDVRSQEQLDMVSGRMNIAALPAPASGAFNDVGGNLFRPGATSGSFDAAVLPMPPASGPALPRFEDIKSMSLQSAASASGSSAPALAADRRALKAQSSEVPDVDPRTARDSEICILHGRGQHFIFQHFPDQTLTLKTEIVHTWIGQNLCAALSLEQFVGVRDVDRHAIAGVELVLMASTWF